MSSVLHTLRLSLLALPLIACGSSGSKDPVIVDAPTNGSGDIDAPITPANCLLASTLGSVTPTQQGASMSMSQGETMTDYYTLQADLNQDSAPDLLYIEFYKGAGTFSAGFPTAAKTIDLGDATESQYATCGACVHAYTDFDTTTGMPTADDGYLATAGTLNLTQISDTMVSGTLTNVTFTHVTIDGMSYMSTPAADGCTSTLASMSFSAVPAAAVNGFVRIGIKMPNQKHR